MQRSWHPLFSNTYSKGNNPSSKKREPVDLSTIQKQIGNVSEWEPLTFGLEAFHFSESPIQINTSQNKPFNRKNRKPNQPTRFSQLLRLDIRLIVRLKSSKLSEYGASYNTQKKVFETQPTSSDPTNQL